MAFKRETNSGTCRINQLPQKSMDNTVRGLQALGNLSSIYPENRDIAVPLPSSYLQYPMSAGGPSHYAPPPLPPRRTGAYPSYPSRYGRMAGMGGMYSPHSRYPTLGYSSPFGNYRMGPYGQYGAPNDSYNSFIQMAEESTRPAFESIESVVEVVSSISMMLESTYHAVHSSYSAILGVIDQFSRLKDHLAQILSVLALLRGLRWLCLKALYILRLRKTNPSVEEAWSSAEKFACNSQMPEMPEEIQRSAWPFLMFIGLVIGAPWLMFKLLSKNVKKTALDKNVFIDENGKALLTTAAYNFNATQRGELSFRAGEKLYISPKSYRNNNGWVYARNLRKEVGLIPLNYLVMKRKPVVKNAISTMEMESPPLPLPDETPVPDDTPFHVAVPPTDLKSSDPNSQTPEDQSVDAPGEQTTGDDTVAN